MIIHDMSDFKGKNDEMKLRTEIKKHIRQEWLWESIAWIDVIHCLQLNPVHLIWWIH